MRAIKIILSIALLAFYLDIIAQQVNTLNTGGIILSLTLIVVLVWNIFLRDEYRALYKSFKQTRIYAQRYWNEFERYN